MYTFKGLMSENKFRVGLTAEELKVFYLQAKKDEEIFQEKLTKVEEERLKIQDELKLKALTVLLVKKAWTTALGGTDIYNKSGATSTAYKTSEIIAVGGARASTLTDTRATILAPTSPASVSGTGTYIKTNAATSAINIGCVGSNTIRSTSTSGSTTRKASEDEHISLSGNSSDDDEYLKALDKTEKNILNKKMKSFKKASAIIPAIKIAGIRGKTVGSTSALRLCLWAEFLGMQD